MEKRRFYFSIAGHLAVLLLAVSPLAPIVGIAVVAFFVAPVLALFAGVGGVSGGHDADLFVAASFLAVGALAALVALAFFYRAAGELENEAPEIARQWIARGLSIGLAPIVMFLCYRSLGIS